MYKKDCFAYEEVENKKTCSALTKIDCDKCKFYLKKYEYIQKIKKFEDRK